MKILMLCYKQPSQSTQIFHACTSLVAVGNRVQEATLVMLLILEENDAVIPPWLVFFRISLEIDIIYRKFRAQRWIE